MIGLYGDAADDAGSGSGDLARISRVGLRMSALDHPQRTIANIHFARLAVQFKKERASAIGMRFADGQKLDDERLARFDLDSDFFAGL